MVFGRPVFLCISGVGLKVIDVRNPSIPRLLLFHRRERGLLGALAWKNGLVLWGDSGAVYRPLDVRKGLAQGIALSTDSVVSAVAHRMHLFLLSREALRVYDGSNRQVAELQVENVRDMLRIRDRLILSGPDTALAIDVARPAYPGLKRRYAVPGLTRVGDPHRLTGGGDEVAFDTGGAARIVLLRDDADAPDERAVYDAVPWWMFAPVLGRTVARIDGDSLAIYRTFGRRALKRSQIERS
jgi:hypothetical protein